MAEALEVSVSGFHAHRRKDQGQRRQEDGELSAARAPVFAASHQNSNHRQPVAENRLANVPAPDWPDQVRVADITCIDTGEGWLYLAGILDACARVAG